MHSLTLPILVTWTLLGASAWAVREDLLAHRIPNRLTGSLLCVALALQFAFGGWSGLGYGMVYSILCFAGFEGAAPAGCSWVGSDAVGAAGFSSMMRKAVEHALTRA